MADVPNINPLRPLWPTRPEERGQKKRNPEEEQEKDGGNKNGQQDEQPQGDGSHDGHIDEYV